MQTNLIDQGIKHLFHASFIPSGRFIKLAIAILGYLFPFGCGDLAGKVSIGLVAYDELDHVLFNKVLRYFSEEVIQTIERSAKKSV